jgi:hypothetical protein
MVAGLGAEFLYLFAARQNAWLPPLAMLCPGMISLGLCFWKRGATPWESTAHPGAEAISRAAAEPEEIPPNRAPQPAANPPQAPPEPEVPPAPEPQADPVEVVAAYGFPAEYAWDPAPATRSAPDPESPTIPEPEPAPPPPEPPAPAKKAARKAAKKAAAKKAAKKAPAAKAARKSARKPAADETDPAG